MVACGQTPSPSSPSSTGPVAPGLAGSTTSESSAPSLAAQGQQQIGFGFNGTVSGFPKGIVFLTGGGAYDRATGFVKSGGGFKCLDTVAQGPLSISINPEDPGGCLTGEGVRWDTAALLTDTPFKCTGAGAEAQKTATTSDHTIVIQADLYRASNGNDESFTAKMIVSDEDLDTVRPGVQNLWLQNVGCGTAVVNFSR